MKTLIHRIGKFKKFLGKEVWSLFIVSVFIGFFWFAVESSFVIVIQGFLKSVNLLSDETVNLPSFYPTSPIGSVLCLMLFGLFRAISISIKIYFTEVTNQAFVRYQRQKVISYSLSQTTDVSMHTVMDVFSNKIGLSAAVIQFSSQLIITSVSSLLFLVLGLLLAPTELLLGLAILFILNFPFGRLNKHITALGSKLSIEGSNLYQVMIIGLRNHFLLKIYGLTKVEIAKGQKAAKDYESYYKKYIFLASIKTAFPQLAGAFVVGLMSYVSLVYTKTSSINLISFIYVFMRLAQNLSEGSSLISSIKFNINHFRELYHWDMRASEYFKINDLQTNKDSSLEIKDIEKRGVSYELKDVAFKYDNAPFLFSNLSFSLNRSEVLLIKGKSGTGKSTLLTLLLGLQKPTDGKIYLNTEEVDVIRNSLAPVMSYVGPEPYLIGGSFRENLLYGNNLTKDYSDEELYKVLKQAQLHDIVQLHPEGLEKQLKEVTELSTGQKQRLSIARALLRNPKLLILDEATANLDHSTEKEIVSVIEAISTEITTIIISHKNSFDRIATKVLDFDHKPTDNKEFVLLSTKV